jgi:hypothetical protein
MMCAPIFSHTSAKSLLFNGRVLCSLQFLSLYSSFHSVLGISLSFLRKYSSDLFFISRCRFNLFDFILSAAMILRRNTHCGRSSVLITKLVKPKDKYDSSYFNDFGLDIQLRLLFAVGSLSSFLFIAVKI